MTPRILVLAFLLALVTPAAAVAQKRQVGAEAAGARLLVADRGDEICIDLRDARRIGEDCRRPPRTPFASEIRQSGNEDRTVLAGMVPASVATVEVQHGRDARTRASTTLGAYAGRHATEVRFFAVATGAEPTLLRFYDASGRLIGASDEFLDHLERPLHGPVVLRRSGSRPRWRLTASVHEQLDPRPDRPDRMAQQLCLSFTVGNGTETTCSAAPGGPTRFAPELRAGCGSDPRLLSAVVEPAIRRVAVVLGSGRKMSVSTRALPARLRLGARFVAVTLPRSEAVRRVLTLDERGRVHNRAELRAAPAGTGCRNGGGVMGLSVELPGGEAGRTDAAAATDLAASTPSGGRLLLGDRGDDLCLAVVLEGKRDAFCARPPLDPAFLNYKLVRVGDRAIVAGVAHRDARPPELVLDDGARLRTSLQEPGAYAGRYREFVRVFAVDIPAGRRAVRLITRDAAGRVVLSASGPERPAPREPSRSVLRSSTSGAVLDVRARAEAFSFSYEGHEDRYRVLCLTPRLAGRSLIGRDEGCDGTGTGTRRTITGLASCAGRRVVVYGTLAARDRGVEVLLADGRRLRARTAAVPRSLRFDARVFALVVPPRAAVSAILVRRARSTLRLRAPLPPAVRQCGYGFELPEF